MQLNKPKAPPPPPPGMGSGVPKKSPGVAVKVVGEQGSPNSSPPSGAKRDGSGTITDDFVVDVSSPCKIVTPKTGLDFLDNW